MTGFSWWIAQQAGASPLVQFIPLVLIFVLFYFMIIRPQRKRDSEHKNMLNNLRRGDKVITSSGVHGEISALTPDTIIVEIAPKVKVTMQRNAVVVLTARGNERSTVGETESAEEESTEEANSSPSKSFKKKKK
ncbi:preprotein translocase subunit YajC [Myxococcota bacterium]|nr:preprotein translocase subunit YajC [Myxococcota bacterium]